MVSLVALNLLAVVIRNVAADEFYKGKTNPFVVGSADGERGKTS
jgi:hypothetical protein